MSAHAKQSTPKHVEEAAPTSIATFIGGSCMPCTDASTNQVASLPQVASQLRLHHHGRGDEGHAAAPIHSPLSSLPHSPRRQHQPSSTGPSGLSSSKSMPSRGETTQERRHRPITADLGISPELSQTRWQDIPTAIPSRRKRRPKPSPSPASASCRPASHQGQGISPELVAPSCIVLWPDPPSTLIPHLHRDRHTDRPR